ncbi:MAG: hypothetical protein RLZZ26_100 [Candidatus Parcubacteria bacterium]|jgi:MFS family permease
MRKKLNAIYLMHSLIGLAGSFTGIFIPAYLVSLGYVPSDVFRYFLIYAVTVFAIFFCAALLARKTGIRALVIASFPFSLAYIALLYVLHAAPVPLTLIAIVQGTGAGLYWFALHVFFTTNTESTSLGTNVGKLFGFPQIVGLFGPLIGGIIALHYGFPTLLAFGGLVFLVSSIPLFWIPDISPSYQLSLSAFVGLFRRFRRYTLVEFFENVREELEATVWPLFIYLTFRSALSVGLIGAFASVGSIIFTLLIGRYTDRVNPKIFIRIGAVLMIGIWLARFVFPHTPFLLYALTVLAGLLACLIEVPFTSFIYGLAKQTNPIEFILYREVVVTAARIGIYSVALLTVTHVSDLFVAGAVASAFILLF